MTVVIDAHHHLWRYSEAEYGWITPEMGVLKRDFLADELRGEMAAARVDGAVVVQARQTLEETRWLLEVARENDFVRGVVGWVPLLDEGVGDVLKEFLGAKKLRGVRHVVQAEPEGFMLREDFNAGVAALKGTGLVYDILIHEGQLKEVAEFVRRHPEQVFVLDHLAKPKIRAGEIEPWRTNLRELADVGNVYCKVSGMVTEADWGAWTLEGLRLYLDAAVDVFGVERLMVGSDWPVCLVASGYGRWWETVRKWVGVLPVEQREMVLGETAKRVYEV